VLTSILSGPNVVMDHSPPFNPNFLVQNYIILCWVIFGSIVINTFFVGPILTNCLLVVICWPTKQKKYNNLVWIKRSKKYNNLVLVWIKRVVSSFRQISFWITKQRDQKGRGLNLKGLMFRPLNR
jgi:hypothetical protein